MKFKPKRGMGILLMTISVVFMIAALYTLFFFTIEPHYLPKTMPEKDDLERARKFISPNVLKRDYPEENEKNSGDWYMDPSHFKGAIIPSRSLYKWPYRWISQPLAIVGISLFLAGLFVGYRDDISEIF